LISNVLAYFRAKLSDAFDKWSDEELEDFIEFHLKRGTLKVLTRSGQVVAVLCGWQQVGPDRIPFTWQETDPNGDHWYWHQFAANSPEDAMSVAASFVLERPQSALLPSVGFRNGKWRRYKFGILGLYKKGNTLYDGRRSSTT